MEFRECYQEIINRVSFDQELVAQISQAEVSIFGDENIIEVDDNGRMVRGKLGNKLNRIEEVVVSTGKLRQEDKNYIVDQLIEPCRLSAGAKMIETDKEIAREIRSRFGV